MKRCVLLDIGGVVHDGRVPYRGAVDAISRLREAGMPVRFITNTTRRTKAEILLRLQAQGIEVHAEELFTPSQTARRWLEERDLSAELLVHPRLRPDFEGISGKAGTALVVGDAGYLFDYDHLNEAYRLLLTGAPFLALVRNRSFGDEDGGLSLDGGPFVAALEFAAQREAVVVGKPSAEMFAAAAASAGREVGDCVIVGDDVEGDILGALAAGVGQAILVRSGKYRDGDEGDAPAFAVADDLAAAADLILAES